MAYNEADLGNDLFNTGETMHLAYRRAKFLLDRWNSGMSDAVQNDTTEYYDGVTGIDIHNFINRCSELVTDYETNTSAKLNTVLKLSNLTLPDVT